ncbi:MAG TPA: hypothetical protein VEB22_14815 [Phycisphaerales bacterium]|nr:hypothetical protein [Phycisphaerales bacterium]
MVNLPGLTCPECGWTAQFERQTRHRGRLRGWRIAGLASLLAGYCLLEAAQVARHGWAGAIPDWALARWCPTDVPPPAASTTLFQRRQALLMIGRPPTAGNLEAEWLSLVRQSGDPTRFPVASMTTQEQLFLETWRRIEADAMPQWLVKHYLVRLFEAEPLLATINPPTAWPSDACSPAACDTGATRRWLPLQPRCDFQKSGPGALRATVFVTIKGRRFDLGFKDYPVDLSRPTMTFMQSTQHPDAASVLARAVSTSIGTFADQGYLGLRFHSADGAIAPYITVRARILFDDVEIGTSGPITLRIAGRWIDTRNVRRIGLSGSPSTLLTLPVYKITGDPEKLRAAVRRASHARVEFIGDTAAATESYLQDWSALNEAWAGTLQFVPTKAPWEEPYD